MFEVLTELRLSLKPKNIVYCVTAVNVFSYFILVKQIAMNNFYYLMNETNAKRTSAVL